MVIRTAHFSIVELRSHSVCTMMSEERHGQAVAVTAL